MAPSREERKAVARRGFEAFNSGDSAPVVDLLAKDVEVFASPELPNSGRFHGQEGYLEWSGPWVEVWQDLDMEVTELIPVGERHVVAAVHQTGRGRAGIEVTMDVGFIFEIRDDGLVSYLALMPDGEQALELAREREAGA
jgi:ketosteroid isomerase-like protein